MSDFHPEQRLCYTKEASNTLEGTASIRGLQGEHRGEVSSSCHLAMLVPGRVLCKTDYFCRMLKSVCLASALAGKSVSSKQLPPGFFLIFFSSFLKILCVRGGVGHAVAHN